MSASPDHITPIGDEIAIRWNDGTENYFRMDYLRSKSPSAENTGEYDLTGQPILEPAKNRDFSGIHVTSWIVVGSYAIQFQFSDGHNTGLYTFDYLRELGSEKE